jgi:hypothetical protein
MNVLRSLARSLFRSTSVGASGLPRLDPTAAKVKQVPAVHRHVDTFEASPHKGQALLALRGERTFFAALQSAAGLRDGFDGVKSRPLDLSGGVARAQVQTSPVAPKSSVAASNGFSASLDDL